VEFLQALRPGNVADAVEEHRLAWVLTDGRLRVFSELVSSCQVYSGVALWTWDPYAGVAPGALGRASWRALREVIPSLVNTFRRCHSTVRALM
jgi:hypothetical protein